MPTTLLDRRRSALRAIPWLLVLGGLSLLVLVARNGYLSLVSIESAARERGIAQEALIVLHELHSRVGDVESAQRAYVLTGDAEFLDTYAADIAKALAFARQFRQFVSPVLSGSLPLGLEALVRERITLVDRVIESRRLEGEQAARMLVASKEGKRVMDRLIRQVDDLEGHLHEVVERRDALIIGARGHAWLTAWMLTGSGSLLIVFASVLLRWEQRRRDRAEEALAEVNAGLEATVAERTSDLQRMHEEAKDFARQLDRGIEAERRRLAREVHDQLGQVFTVQKIAMRQLLEPGAELGPLVERITGLLDEGVGTCRRIAAELRPPLLDDLGLEAALVLQAERLAAHSGVTCHTTVQDSADLSEEQINHLYRITQEALTNVMRHASARRVWIDGGTCAAGYRLSVEDDGAGHEAVSSATPGFLTIRERAALAGGTVEFGPGRAGGFRITVTLPLGRGNEAADAAAHR